MEKFIEVINNSFDLIEKKSGYTYAVKITTGDFDLDELKSKLHNEGYETLFENELGESVVTVSKTIN